jgi:hypothetical protein
VSVSIAVTGGRMMMRGMLVVTSTVPKVGHLVRSTMLPMKLKTMTMNVVLTLTRGVILTIVKR